MIGLKKVVFAVLAGLALVVTISTGFASKEATIIPDTNVQSVVTIIPDTNGAVATIIPDTNWSQPVVAIG